jgi:plastocyanin
MKHNKGSVGAVGAATAAIILLAGITADPAMLYQTASAGPMSDAAITPATTTTITSVNNNNTTQHRVAVGGGNLTMSINQFSPSTIEIHPGESVTFYAPSGSTELHNVVLDMSNGTALSSIELAFLLPSGFSTEALQLVPPDNFGEPIIQNTSDGRQSIVALNKVLYHPSVVYQNGDASYLHEQELIQQMEQGAQQSLSMRPSLSANYSMQGTEAVVSSGLILDTKGFTALEQEQESASQQQAEAQQQSQQQEPTQQGVEEESLPPAYPILSNFTVTFKAPGLYPFFCAFHPGMTGVVHVVEASARSPA